MTLGSYLQGMDKEYSEIRHAEGLYKKLDEDFKKFSKNAAEYQSTVECWALFWNILIGLGVTILVLAVIILGWIKYKKVRKNLHLGCAMLLGCWLNLK